MLLVAKKGRLGILDEVSLAYQAEQDHANGVSRGVVKTAHKISDKDREAISNLLQQATGKKVAVEFTVDESVVAGVQAQVGSLSIDDSVSGHFKRMRDELNRRIN